MLVAPQYRKILPGEGIARSYQEKVSSLKIP